MRKNNAFSIYRQDLRLRILRMAMQNFRQMGIKAVRMDDLASKLSISKRTLYEIYNNKEDLLLECLKYHKEDFDRRMHSQITEDSSSIDIMSVYLRQQASEAGQTNPLFYYELGKYPRVKEYLEHDREQNREQAIRMMQRGVEEGYFRRDINYQLVNVMVDAFMRQMMEYAVHNNYSLQEIVYNLLSIILRGICTERGLAKLKDLDDLIGGGL